MLNRNHDRSHVAWDIETTGFNWNDEITVSGFWFPSDHATLLLNAETTTSTDEDYEECLVSMREGIDVCVHVCEDEHALLGKMQDVVFEQFDTNYNRLIAFNADSWQGGFDLPFLRTRCLAQYTLDKLHQSTLELNTQYVNCWEDHSHFSVLYRILDGLDKTLDIHRQSTPQTLLLDRLHDYDGPPYVVILDEVDQLDDLDVLYELYRTPNLSMILIGNQEEQFFSRLDGRVASRLRTSARIEFDHYGNDELIVILEDRVRWGLHPDAIDESQLRDIADAAAGDARVAIGILRTAARHANQHSTGAIADQFIMDAIPEAKAEITQKNIEKLTDDQRILYKIISDAGDIAPGDLYERYEERADDPKTKRMVRNYLTKLVHYNLIEAVGKDRGRIYCTPRSVEPE